MDMIEKVARAICARHRNPDALVPRLVITDHGHLGTSAAHTGPLEPAWVSYKAEARAAIEAMIGPTDEMLDAVALDGHATERNVHRTLYNALLTTALASPPQSPSGQERS